MRLARLAVVLCLVAGCGGDSGSAGPSEPSAATTPATIVATSSTGLNVSTGQTATVSVQVKTSSGAPLPSVLVTFVAGGGGSVASPSSRTDANGTASTTWILGNDPGQQTVTASVAGLAANVVFSATVTVSITGTWTGSVGFLTGQQNFALNFVETGGNVTGTGTITNTPTGTRALSVTGNYAFPSTLNVNLTSGSVQPLNYTATVSGKTLVGKLNGSGFSNETLVLTKQ